MRFRACAWLGLLGALAACAHTPPSRVENAAPADLDSASRTRARAASTPFIPPSSYVEAVRAELHASRGELREAIAGFEAAMALGEDDPLLQARLAELHDLAGDAGSARRVLEHGLASAPDSEALWRAAARIARRHGASEMALAAYEHAEQSAETLQTAFERIDYLRELGHDERARAVLDQLAGTHVADVRVHSRLQLERAIAHRDRSALLAAALDWLALGARDPRLSARAASLLLELGEPALSLRLLERVPLDAQSAPVKLKALLQLGRADACAELIAMTSVDWLGGASAVAAAKLQLGDSDDLALATRELPAMLELPSQRPAARDALVNALRASALPALASELSSCQAAQ